MKKNYSDLGIEQLQKLGVYSLQVPLRLVSLSFQILVLAKLENSRLQKLVKNNSEVSQFSTSPLKLGLRLNFACLSVDTTKVDNEYFRWQSSNSFFS